MDDLQSSNQTRLSRSCNPPSYIHQHRSRLRESAVSECEGKRGYDTFAEFPGNSPGTRSRSVSVTFATYGPRALKRMSLALPTKGFDPSALQRIHDPADRHSCSTDDSASVDEESDSEKRYWGFTRAQCKCAVALAFLSIVDTMGFGIFSPFFPIVAQEKNMSEVQIGFIFASFSMAGIFGSIFTGSLLVQVGPKFIILAGMFWCAGATICFGFLDQVPEEYFFWLCCACRVFMGVGSSSAFTALFAVIFQEFGDRSLTVIGISESLCSIGGITAPLLGGGLYSLGGFYLPFAVLGSLSLLVVLVCALLLPSVKVDRQLNAVSPAWLLLNFHGLFASLYVMLCFLISSFLTANFAIFLTDSFNLSSVMVGVYFLIFSLLYGIATPIFGHFADSRDIGAHIMTGCCFILGIVLTLYCPADVWMSWFGWDHPRKWLVIASSAISGICIGGMIMPTFGEMIIAAKQMKLQENELAQYGMVSGLWNTMFSVGDILGPTMGGALVAKFSFNNALAMLGLFASTLAVSKAIHLTYLGCKRTGNEQASDNDECSDEEREALLGNNRSSIQT